MNPVGSRRQSAAAVVLALGLGAAPEALADDKPFVEGRIVFRLDGEEIYRSDDPDEETRDIYPRINSDLTFHLGHGFEFFNVLDFKEYEDLDPGEKRYFSDLGLVVEELGLRYRGDGWMVQAGKLHPVFGLAYDDAPGLFGDDFPKDYELEEMWGAGFALEVPLGSPLLGDATLSGSVFMTDRTILAGSAFAEREVDKIEDGGAANTEYPESFVLALDGGDGSLTPGFGYQLGFIHRAAGEGDEGTELGFVLAVTQKTELDEDWGLFMIAEAAHFEDYEGSLDDVSFGTLGAELSWQGFYLSGTVAGIIVDADEGDGYVDHLLTFDFGHEWRIGASRISAEVAWQAYEEEGLSSEGYGFRLRYRLPI